MRRDKECILRRGLGQHGTELPPSRFSPRNRPFHPFLPSLLAAVALALAVWGAIQLVRRGRMRAIGFEGARWIWIERSPDPRPVHFSAVREFDLPSAPGRAEARIFVDRNFQLFVNGTRAGIGGEAPGDPAAKFEVGELLHAGPNVVGIVAESARGLGGILFSIRIGAAEPVVVSDGKWTVDPTGAQLLRATKRQAAVIGAPPMHPWGWISVEPATHLAGVPLNSRISEPGSRQATVPTPTIAGLR